MSRSLIIAFICLIQNYLLAQTNDTIFENIRVVDSSFYNGKKIYVFSDKSWEYESTFEIYEKHNANLVDGYLAFSREDLFEKNFKENKVSSYDNIDLSKMTDTVNLKIDNFNHPVENKKISSHFKIRWGRWHNGIDYAVPVGTQVKSSWSGMVRYAEFNHGGFGNLVIIRHHNGLETFYAHLSTINVKPGELVESGDIIGNSGNTGRSTGPHLHYEIRFFHNPINPLYFFDKKEISICASVFDKKGKPSNKPFSFKEKLNLENKTVVVKQRRSRRKTVGNM